MILNSREERRRAELDVVLKDFGMTTTAAEKTVNLSRGGTFATMEEPLPVGTMVKFELTLPDDTVLHGVGKVAWQKAGSEDVDGGAGIGIQFINLFGNGNEQIETALNSLAKTPSASTGTEQADKVILHLVPDAEAETPRQAVSEAQAPKAQTQTSLWFWGALSFTGLLALIAGVAAFLE